VVGIGEEAEFVDKTITPGKTAYPNSRSKTQREETISSKYYDTGANTKLQFFKIESTHGAHVTVEALDPTNAYSRADSKNLNFRYGLVKGVNYNITFFEDMVDHKNRWKHHRFHTNLTDFMELNILPDSEYGKEEQKSVTNPGYTYREKDYIGFFVGYKCGKFGQYSVINEELNNVKEGNISQKQFDTFFPKDKLRKFATSMKNLWSGTSDSQEIQDPDDGVNSWGDVLLKIVVKPISEETTHPNRSSSSSMGMSSADQKDH
jgi:hypothetical protein